MKKTIIAAGTILLFATSLLFLSGCGNSLQSPPETGEPGMGVVTLTIGQESRSRTILPDVALANFTHFRVVFDTPTTPTTHTWANTGGTTISSTASVAEGTWAVTVTGYLSETAFNAVPSQPAATYTRSAFVVNPAPTPNPLTVTIEPIESGVDGFFTWAITGVPGGATIALTVDGVSVGTTATSPLPAGVALAAGVDRRVILTVTNAAGDQAVVTSSMQIFGNMTSHWDVTILPDQFLVSLTETILRSWNGTAWTLVPAITGAHFAAMTPAPGVVGLAGFDNAQILGTFNLLSPVATAPPAAGEYTVVRLRQLADATRVQLPTGTPADFINAGGFPDQAAAEAAIIALTAAPAGNGTAITAADITWGAGNLTATVDVGPYTATRTFTTAAWPYVAGEDVDITISFVTLYDRVGTVTPGGIVAANVLGGGLPMTFTVIAGTGINQTGWSFNGYEQTGATTVTAALVAGQVGYHSVTVYFEYEGRSYSTNFTIDVTL